MRRLRTFIAIVLAVAVALSMSTVAFGASNSQVVVNPDTRTWQDGFGFHCNAAKGNGATDVEYIGDVTAIKNSIKNIKKQPANSMVVEKGEQKNIFGTKIFPINLERVDQTTLWNLITDDVKCSTCGRTDWVTYSNNSGVINGKNIQAHHPPLPPPPPEEEFYGELTLNKFVDDDGKLSVLIEWLFENYDEEEIFAILGGVTFELFKSDENGTKGDFVTEGRINDAFVIGFDDPVKESGWYLVCEVLSGMAADVFEQADDLLIYFNAETEAVTDPAKVFDKSAFYTIVNKYGSDYLRKLGYPGLNNTGDVFYIGVTNTTTGTEYPSFCAHAGSQNFAGDNHLGCAGYMVSKEFMPLELRAEEYKAFMSALNYIEDKIGNLNTNRVITQTVIWILLGDIDVDDPAFGNVNLTEAEMAGVLGALAAVAEEYVGEGIITELIYMVCETHKTEFEYCQPQLVPVYGPMFINKPGGGGFYGEISFSKILFGGLIPLGEYGPFAFDLFKIVGDEETKIATYETDDFGVVSTGKLDPGKYVFKEALKTYTIPGIGDYKLLWKASYPGGADIDGLYFEITSKGEAIWEYFDGVGDPVVDNSFWNKSVMQWVLDEQTGAGTPGGPFEGGFIFYPGGAGGDAVIYEVTQPDCTHGGVIWFYYSNADGSKGQPLMDLAFADPLGHDYVLSDDGSGIICERCGTYFGWWDLGPELYALYLALGGIGSW